MSASEQPAVPRPAPTAARPSKGSKRPMWRRARVVGPVCGVLGLIVGAAGGGGDTTTTAASSAPTATTTVTAPAAEAQPAQTVTAAAATVTVTAEAPAAVVAEAPVAATRSSVSNGDWLVGTDVEPGTYRSPGVQGGLCYADTNNGSGGINQQEVTPEGPTIITVAASDKVFSVSGCEPFVLQ